MNSKLTGTLGHEVKPLGDLLLQVYLASIGNSQSPADWFDKTHIIIDDISLVHHHLNELLSENPTSYAQSPEVGSHSPACQASS